MSSLSVESLSKVFGTVAALGGVSFTAAEGEMLVLVGPSGCGKTTCLRCVAGLEHPTGGRVVIGDRPVFDAASGILLPPEKRQLGMVFQSYAVWPHMTVFDNVAFPLRAKHWKRSEIEERVNSTLALVQLGALAGRYSSQISGGQQQRVALARSLAAQPRLLLFDEPLSNLDANLRVQMRTEIRDLQQKLGFTAVYVTHDQIEAMALADRIAVMEHGQLRQIGAPREIYDNPASRFIAGFMGTTNLLDGRVESRDGDTILVRIGEGLAVKAKAPGAPAIGDTLSVSIRPEAVALFPAPPAGGDAVNVWPGVIRDATYVGSAIIYRITFGPAVLEVHARPNEDYPVGASVHAIVPVADCKALTQ